MANLNQMLGIIESGGQALRQGIGAGMDRQRQLTQDERQKKLDEEEAKERAARLGLVDIQTKGARRDLDNAIQGDTESKQLGASAKEILQQEIDAFSQTVKTPEDEEILKEAKNNLRMANAISKYDPEKAGKLFVSPFDMKKQQELKNLEKGKTQAEIQATQAMTGQRIAETGKTKKETSLLGQKESNADKWQTMQSGEDLVQVNPKTGEVRKLGIPGKGVPPAQAKAQSADALDTQINLIDQMIGSGKKGEKDYKPPHSGFKTAIGSKIGSPSYGMGFKEKPLEGTSAADFEGLLGQVKGGAFLQAIPQMKGSGQLSDAEGKKLEAATTRLSGSLSEDEFKKAAQEYKNILLQIKRRTLAGSSQNKPGADPLGLGTGTKDPLGLDL